MKKPITFLSLSLLIITSFAVAQIPHFTDIQHPCGCGCGDKD